MIEQREVAIFKNKKKGLDFESIESKIKSEELNIKNIKKLKNEKVVTKESKYCKSCKKIEKKKNIVIFVDFIFVKVVEKKEII